MKKIIILITIFIAPTILFSITIEQTDFTKPYVGPKLSFLNENKVCDATGATYDALTSQKALMLQNAAQNTNAQVQQQESGSVGTGTQQ